MLADRVLTVTYGSVFPFQEGAAVSYQEHNLLPTQTDDVYGVVESAGFDPNEFTWSRIYGDVFGAFVPVLIHAPTNWEFVFDFDPQHGLHAAQWSPGEETPKDKTYNLDWPLMRRAVDLWLANIKRERSSPDLWAQLDKQRELLASTVPFKSDDGDNSPFNAVEQAQISAQLDGIRELLVREHQVDSRVLESIEELREASTRIGRKEWLTIFIGTIFMWGFGGLVPFDGARQALTLVTHGIGHLFGGGLVQLPAT